MDDPASIAVRYAETPLPRKPRLVSWVTVVNLGDDRLQFRSQEFAYTLQNSLFIDLLEIIKPLLDGNHTVDEITTAGEPRFLPTTVSFFLKMLRSHGLLQEGDCSSHPSLTPQDLEQNDGTLRFLSHFEADSHGLLASLKEARVGLLGAGQLMNSIRNSLEAIGIHQIADLDALLDKGEHSRAKTNGLKDALKKIDFLVACQESVGFSFFETINEICLSTRTRWIRVAIEGTTAFLGPTIVPFETACYACYEGRLNSNIPDLPDFLAYKSQVKSNHQPQDERFFAPLWSLVASQTVIEVARILSGFSQPTTIGRYYEMSVTSPMPVGHHVLRLPRCPVCHGERPQQEAWDSISLSSDE
jgi:bacteriocin biosynthesis cyclodehydratase domain-containing protein